MEKIRWICLLQMATVLLLAWSHPGYGSQIHESAKAGDIGMAKAIIKSASTLVNDLDENGATSLHLACAEGQAGVVSFLIDNKADINAKDHGGSTPLLHAAKAKNKTIVELLLEHGANAKTANQNGDYPLAWAAYSGHDDMVELLLARKVNVNARNNNGARLSISLDNL
jgi:ankyrin repeat protein